MKWVLLNTLLTVVLVCLLVVQITHPNSPYGGVIIALLGAIDVGIWMIGRRIRRGES